MNKYREIFLSFLALGLSSFGGPAAHLGYFNTTFVKQKKWLTEQEYGRLVALSQFLPGPGSSQVGFAIGLHREGLIGGILAFIGFTLPSFLLMLLLAVGIVSFSEQTYLLGVIHVLKLVAVVVVIDAIMTMGKSFCHTSLTRGIALTTAIVLVSISMPLIQWLCLIIAAIIGYKFLALPFENNKTLTFKLPISGYVFLVLLGISFSGIVFFSPLFSQTFIAGSMVFGGGHVVLPLLQNYFVSTIGQEHFLTGYAAAQAVPGPMFTFATYLGALSTVNPLVGASIATIGVFLPGFLLILAFHQQWQTLSQHPKVAGVVMAINASVVGLLIATLYQPILQTSVNSFADIALIVIGFSALRFFRVNILLILAVATVLGVAQTWLSSIV